MVFSQICYAHVENGLFVDVYPDIFLTEIFGFEDIVKVVVTESENGKYWAIIHGNNEYFHINKLEDEDKTRRLLKKGRRMAKVDIKRWNK